MRGITLFIPGLFGPDIAIHPDDLPNLPALNWFLTKGTYQSIQQISPSYTLCELFGLSTEHGDYPVAAISRLSDDKQHSEGLCLRADPVHIRADRDSLILIDNNQFTLNQRDALALAADINVLLELYNIKLEVPDPYRWYLRVNKDYKLKTVPVDSVVGKDIFPFMPTSDDRLNIIQLMNDIQMTLHNSDVNKKRKQEKQLPINSVWFWGYGALPKIIDCRWSFVCSDEMLAKGLSMITATPFEELPDTYNDIKNKSSSYNDLAVLNSFQKFNHYNDLDGWFEALLFLEANWFSPLQAVLKRKELEQLTIRTDINTITFNKTSRYKIWKKKKILTCMDAGKKH